MFGRKTTLFRLLGFDVKVDASWLLLAVLVTWSLASGVFPDHYKDLARSTYWWMGIVGAAGLFASIILHELGHSLVARYCGIPIKDITLFIFGGVAEMEDEPPTARCEFSMAVAGPLTSIILSGVFFGARFYAGSLGLPTPGIGVLAYLGWINGVLALFNLLPAFPLDGGRVLRAGLWAWKGDLRSATRIAAGVGSSFGMVLIALGVLAFVGGNFIGGLWWFMIGMFMRNASQMSYQHLLVTRALEGMPLRRFMQAEPVTVPGSISIRDLVDDYIYRFHYKMFPVVEAGRLLGCVSTREIKDIPREEWDTRKVSEILVECSKANMIHPDDDTVKALSIMNRTGNSRLLAVENGRLVGILALKDLLEFLSLKMDLEGARL